jgi:hypothetical protein
MRSLSSSPGQCVLAALFLVLPDACAARSELPEYRTIKATEFGKSLRTERTDAKTLNSALQLTLADITKYFGTAPSVFSAFVDSKNPNSGGATFRVAAKGGEVKGLVTCDVGEKKTAVAVAYIRADAPAGEWGRLVQPPVASTPNSPSSEASAAGAVPAPTGGGAGVSVASMAHVPLRTYNFPDGTGSIGLADGWTTDAQSATRAALLRGPNDAAISIGGMYSVMGPRSTLPRGPNTLVAAYGKPIDVFAALVPQFSQMSVKQGGPARTIDHLAKVADQNNGQMQVLRYGVTETAQGGNSKHYLAMAWVGVSPLPPSMFMVTLTQLRAPDASFERDKPVMFQMINSVKANDAVIQAKSRRELAAQKQSFEAQQARMRAQQSANDAQHKQYWEHQKAMEESHKAAADAQLDQARRNDNFDEYIRGVRTVEDTQSGVKTSVDLGNVDKVVDTLNEADPGRYRQIPLRDEAHPLPGQ